MSDIRDFLSWFDGFSENVKQRPTAQQWAKVVERIKKIEVPPAVATVMPPRVVGNISGQGGSNDQSKPRPLMSKGVAMSAGP
jgi:hypothetical protein